MAATLLVALALVACGDGGQGTEAIACDPLAADVKPIALSTVLAVGKASDGSLYVVDDPKNGEERVFVAHGSGALERKRVLGSGSGGGTAGDTDYTLSFEDGDGPQRLVFKLRAGAVSGIALARDMGRSFLDALSDDAERLTVGSESDLRGRAVHNLSGEIELEYLAKVEVSGSAYTIVVTRPRDDWTYEDFRLFYGAAGHLTERVLTNVSRGSTTHVEFSLDGEAVQAVFGSVLSPSVESTLTIGGESYPIEVQMGASALPASFSFACRR